MHQGYKGGVVTLSLLGTGIEWPILKPNRYNRLVVATADHTLKCQDLFLCNHSSHLKAKKVTHFVTSYNQQGARDLLHPGSSRGLVYDAN